MSDPVRYWVAAYQDPYRPWIPTIARNVWRNLMAHRDGHTGIVMVDIVRFADLGGISSRQYRSALAVLVAANLMKVEL